jgi:hypothetical protein
VVIGHMLDCSFKQILFVYFGCFFIQNYHPHPWMHTLACWICRFFANRFLDYLLVSFLDVCSSKSIIHLWVHILACFHIPRKIQQIQNLLLCGCEWLTSMLQLGNHVELPLGGITYDGIGLVGPVPPSSYNLTGAFSKGITSPHHRIH